MVFIKLFQHLENMVKYNPNVFHFELNSHFRYHYKIVLLNCNQNIVYAG